MTKPVSDSDADIALRRRHLREQALNARQALDSRTRDALAQRIIFHLDEVVKSLAPMTIGFCWPYREEPDLRAWVSAWMEGAEGRVAALPVVLERDAAMVFRPWRPDVPLVRDRHGIPHPASGPSVVPDVVLVPLNAFDSAGYRLGYGGGYFDRTLATMRTTAVGVGFELGRVDSVLPMAHDLPMDWIVTETGARRALRR